MTTSQVPVQAPGWYADPVGQARLRFWDGEHWTVQTTNAKDPSGARPLLGEGFAHLADWLGRLLAFTAVADLLVVAASVWLFTVLEPVGDLVDLLTPGSASMTPQVHDRLATAFLWWPLALALTGLSRAVTGILWWIWQYRLASAAPRGLRRSPVMNLLAWIVPIVGLWWPYQDLNALWRAYGTTNREASQPSPAVFLGWWVTYVGGGFLAGLLYGVSLGGSPDRLLTAMVSSYVLLFAAQAAAAAMACSVVRRLSWRALVYYAS